MKPVIREISGEFVIFQPDKAPAHRAYETISLEWEVSTIYLVRNMTANSPDTLAPKEDIFSEISEHKSTNVANFVKI